VPFSVVLTSDGVERASAKTLYRKWERSLEEVRVEVQATANKLNNVKEIDQAIMAKRGA